MPRAGDAYLNGVMPLTHNPLQRINYQPPNIKSDQTAPAQPDYFTELLKTLTNVTNATINDVSSWVEGLLSWFKPVPQIQGASVVDTNPNLIIAPNFPAESTLAPSAAPQGWKWVNEAGRDSVGSMKQTASGILSELLSNEIAVVEGQKLDLSVWVKWAGPGYTTGTDHIAMGVTRYMNRKEVGSEDLDAVTPEPESESVFPVTFPFEFGGAITTSAWTQLSKTAYEVPSGTDEIRLRLKIAPELTGGLTWWDDASVTKSQPGSGYIGNLIDTTINGLENVNQPGWDLTDLLISMLNQFRTTTDHATRIALLESLNSPGNKINDEFLRVGTTLGSNWNQSYIGSGTALGTWETDGDYAFWKDSGFENREARCRYIATPSTTLTDTQKIIAILGSKSEDSVIIRSHIFLYGRMNTAEDSWIRARFSANGDVAIERNIAGTVTVLASVLGYDILLRPTGVKAPGAGSTITLLCGTASGTRFFEAQINGTTVLTASDSASNVGAAYRGYGHGVLAEGSLLTLGQATPGSLNAWAAVDA